MATPTPEELNKQFEKLQRLATTLGKNLSNFNLRPVVEDAALIGELIEKWGDELNDSLSSVNDLASGFQSVVQEISKGNIGIGLTKKTFNSLTSIAQQLAYEQAGINKLSEKDLQNLLKKSQQAKKDAETNKNILDERKQTLIQENLSNNISLEQKKKNRAELSKINGALIDNQSIIDEESQSYKDLNIAIRSRLDLEEKIGKTMGIAGNAVKGVETALDKMGLGGLGKALGLDKVKEKMDDTAESIAKSENYTGGFKDKMKVLKSGISETGIQFKKSLTDPTVVTTFLINEMVSALISADKATGELAKSFGTSYSEASTLRNELNTVANLSGELNINTADLQKSLIAINKEFGTATMLSGELLKDFTQLTTVAGYTEEAALGLSKITVATGTDLSDNTSEILGQATAFNAVNGLALNEKEIVEGVAKASAATTLSLGMQSGKLAKAVAQSKALGTSLQQVEQIASSLLNFESSISSELEAELLTGKELNLERARLAALNNDIGKVAEEIAGQIGKASDFTEMNVIQQEALAKAVGMTREDLAKSLIEREALAKIGAGDKTALEAYNRLKKKGLSDDQIAAKLGDDKLAAQLKSQSVQERFNASVEKLREIFVSLAEPVLQIISPFMDLATTILPLINIALTPFTEGIKFIGEGISYIVNSVKALFGSLTGSNEQLTKMQQLIGGIAGVYLAIKGYALSTQLIEGVKLGIKAKQSILDQKALFTANKGLTKAVGTAVFNAISSFSKIPLGIGVGLGLVAAAGIASMASKYADDMISPGYGERTLFGPEGAIQLNNKDTVIAGTNLGGNGNSSENSQSISPSINLTPLIERMTAVENILTQIFNKEGNVYLDGTKVGTAMAVSTYRVQ